MSKNKQIGYCYECDEDTVYEIKTVKKQVTVKEHTFVIEVEQAFCTKCNNPVYVKEIEHKNEIVIYDRYKEINGLLTSEEIKEIRRIRGFTQEQLANFLNIGEKDIARYENGYIQTKAIDKLLRLVNDDVGYKTLKRISATTSY